MRPASADQAGAAFLDASAEAHKGPVAAKEFHGLLERLWKAGLPRGDATGWEGVNEIYSVVPGQVTVLTGWPSSGKSEWLDAMLVHLSRLGWKFAMYSQENKPTELHIAKLIEKVAGKPFGAGPTERVPLDDLADLLAIVDESFSFIDGDNLTPKGCIAAAEKYLDQFPDNKRGLVLDPWNEMEHSRPTHLSETEYISQTLSMVRSWARRTKTHVWIVAHPRNQPRENGKLPIPKPDMISGSQHWWNKADCCLTVWRDFDSAFNEVTIYSFKCRFKHVGKIGQARLRYDLPTGRYFDPPVGENIYDLKGKG